MYPYGYDTVGLSFGDITHALNPITHLKAAYGVVTNPLNPLKQTRAILNVFKPAGGAQQPQQLPPQQQYLPPGAYPPAPGFDPSWGAQQQPGYPPPGYYPPPAQQWAPPPAPPSWGGAPPWNAPPPGFAPMGFGQPPMFDYAAPLPPDLNLLYGPQTGWDAAYSGGSGW